MARLLQLLFFVFLILPGCKHEEPNPEQLDPIYSDLVKRQAEDEAALESGRKALAAAQGALDQAEPNTIDQRNAQRDIARAVKTIRTLEQKVLYDSIRARRRLAEDHVEYHKAFVAGKDWPDREEYSQYLVNQRLLAAPRSWDAHVPKLFERKPADSGKKKEAPAAE